MQLSYRATLSPCRITEKRSGYDDGFDIANTDDDE